MMPDQDDQPISNGPTESGVEAVRLVTISIGLDGEVDVQIDPNIPLADLSYAALDFLNEVQDMVADNREDRDE